MKRGTGQRCGYVALLGRPNVGKSTLLNSLLGQKVSITTPKAQTTRHNILGIFTLDDVQIIYVDTPGLHLGSRKALNRHMNRAAASTLGFADAAVLLVEALSWTQEDAAVVGRLAGYPGPVVLAVNKIDKVPDKKLLLPYLAEVAGRRDFAEVIPVSARKGDNVERLQKLVRDFLPFSEFAFPPDQVTNVSVRFLVGELLREKLTLVLRDELPYALTVEIENFAEDDAQVRIGAIIWVEREGQKSIVIGAGGHQLKKIGTLARQDMERELGKAVHLTTWVKVRSGWSDDQRALQQFGYRP